MKKQQSKTATTAIVNAATANLLPTPDGTALQPASINPQRYPIPGRLLFQTLHPRAGEIVVVCEGRSISYFINNGDNPSVTPLGMTQSTALHFIPLSSTQLMILTENDLELVIIDDDATCHLIGPRPDFPAFRFETSSTMVLSETIPGATLKSSYNLRSTTLSATDLDSLSADLRAAYDRLADRAASAGFNMQPRLARYRLLDQSGATLFLSPTVLITPPDGLQCTEDIAASIGSALASREESSLSATIFRTSLRGDGVFDSPWAKLVDRLEVEMTRPFHPVNSATRATARFERQSTDSLSLKFSFAGDLSSLACAMIPKILDRGDTAFSTVAIVRRPFSGTPVDIEVNPDPTDSCTSQISVLSNLLSKPAAQPTVIDDLRLPRRFSATSAFVNGDSIIFGNLTSHGFQGYPLQFYAVSSTDTPWKSAVSIADYSQTAIGVASSSGDSSAPFRLSPFIFCDNPDATEMTIRLQRDGTNYRITIPLKPSPARRFSYWINNSLTPVSIDTPTDNFIIPAARPVSKSYAGYISASSLHDPFNTVSATMASVPPVTAVHTVPRSASGWDSGRRRFYVFSSSGTLLATLHPDRSTAILGSVDSRGIASPLAVTTTCDDNYPLVAVAGKSLIALKNNSVITLVDDLSTAHLPGSRSISELNRVNIATETNSGTLLLAGHDGQLCCIPDISHPDTFTALTGIDARWLMPTVSGIFISDGDQISVFSNVDNCLSADINAMFVSDISDSGNRAAQLNLPLFTDNFNGSVTILGSTTPIDFIPVSSLPQDGSRRVLLNMEINGALRSELRLPVMAQPLKFLAVTVSGHASAQTRLMPPEISFKSVRRRSSI